MLEYFTYKKYKKSKAEKEEKGQRQNGAEDDGKEAAPASERDSGAANGAAPSNEPTPALVLTDDDERFLERLTTPSTDQDGDDEGLRPPLPPRVKTPDLSWDSDSESFRRIKDKEVEKERLEAKGAAKKANRFSLFGRKGKKGPGNDNLDPTKLAVPEPEVDHEKDDLTRVLDQLNLAAKNNKAFSLSAESTELVRRFTVVLKDLVNGVPTAAHDLTSLLEDRDGTLARTFEKLPKSFKKLVTQLPEKLTSTLGPELLAAAAAGTTGVETGAGPAKGGLKGAAKNFFMPKNLADMISKPGAIVGMLKAIMNALKLRWPAFIGTNVIWSVALFLLLFVLWYCHKRGREVRLEREQSSGKVEELPDDPALADTQPTTGGADNPVIVEPSNAE